MSRSRGPLLSDRREDDGPKHDMWVVPYADMLTLLFALFVILYSASEVDRRRLDQMRYGILMAFGDGDVAAAGFGGEAEDRPIGGDLLDGFDLINSQRSAMLEFIRQGLDEEYEQKSGRSLETVLTDDTVSFEMPMAEVFVGESDVMHPGLTEWLGRLLDNSTSLASSIRLTLEGPDETWVVGGREMWSATLFNQRRDALHRFVQTLTEVDVDQVEFVQHFPRRRLDGFQAQALLRVSLSNP